MPPFIGFVLTKYMFTGIQNEKKMLRLSVICAFRSKPKKRQSQQKVSAFLIATIFIKASCMARNSVDPHEKDGYTLESSIKLKNYTSYPLWHKNKRPFSRICAF